MWIGHLGATTRNVVNRNISCGHIFGYLLSLSIFHLLVFVFIFFFLLFFPLPCQAVDSIFRVEEHGGTVAQQTNEVLVEIENTKMAGEKMLIH